MQNVLSWDVSRSRLGCGSATAKAFFSMKKVAVGVVGGSRRTKIAVNPSRPPLGPRVCKPGDLHSTS